MSYSADYARRSLGMRASIALAITLAFLLIPAFADQWVFVHWHNPNVYGTEWGRLLRVMGWWPTWLIAACALYLQRRRNASALAVVVTGSVRGISGGAGARARLWRAPRRGLRRAKDGVYARDHRASEREQRERLVLNQKKWADQTAKTQAETKILSDEDINRERDRPLSDIYRQVTVTPRLEWMTKEYKLDAAQQTKTRALLSLRRNQFIALLDSTQHPTIKLSRLAPLVQRVAPSPAK